MHSLHVTLVLQTRCWYRLYARLDCLAPPHYFDCSRSFHTHRSSSVMGESPHTLASPAHLACASHALARSWSALWPATPQERYQRSGPPTDLEATPSTSTSHTAHALGSRSASSSGRHKYVTPSSALERRPGGRRRSRPGHLADIEAVAVTRRRARPQGLRWTRDRSWRHRHLLMLRCCCRRWRSSYGRSSWHQRLAGGEIPPPPPPWCVAGASARASPRRPRRNRHRTLAPTTACTRAPSSHSSQHASKYACGPMPRNAATPFFYNMSMCKTHCK